MIITKSTQKITVTDDHKIVRDRRGCRLLSLEQNKDYKTVFDKRVLGQGHESLPYGY